ncbi:hypothetical protein DIU36_17880 [Mucilaginibacter rubeus]|nr:hypothetical protein DIU36_17880 [Mucilaginibacter rubeus]
MNWISAFTLNKQLQVTASAGGWSVILAAVPDPYHFKGRNYDYGTGVGFYGQFGATMFNCLFFRFNYRGGLIGTVNGNASH